MLLACSSCALLYAFLERFAWVPRLGLSILLLKAFTLLNTHSAVAQWCAQANRGLQLYHVYTYILKIVFKKSDVLIVKINRIACELA